MKKYLKIFLCFLLSATTVFSSLSVSAFADDTAVVTDLLHVNLFYKNTSGTHSSLNNLIPIPDTYSWVDIIPSNLSGYYSKQFKTISGFTDDISLDGNGTITYRMSFNSNVIINYDCIASIYVNGKLVDSNCSYQINGKSITITVVTLDTYKNAKSHVEFTINNPNYDTKYDDKALAFTVKTDSLTPYITSKSDSFFDGIFGFLTERFNSINDWLSSLRDSIKDIPNSINEYIQKVIDKFKDITDSIKENINKITNSINGFFESLKIHLSNLVDKIKTFFLELGEQITSFALNVKEWFSDLFKKLGDWFASIGQWFKDLWTNISNKIIEIKTDIQDWFESLFVVSGDFWDNYRTNFDDFMADHFGFLYQSMSIITDVLNQFKYVFNGNGSGTITIPRIALPAKLFDGEKEILKSRRFSLTQIQNLDDTGKFKWILETVRIINSALIILLLINRGRKLFDMIITQGEGVEE